jgi:hypothetical protein
MDSAGNLFGVTEVGGSSQNCGTSGGARENDPPTTLLSLQGFFSGGFTCTPVSRTHSGERSAITKRKQRESHLDFVSDDVGEMLQRTPVLRVQWRTRHLHLEHQRTTTGPVREALAARCGPRLLIEPRNNRATDRQSRLAVLAPLQSSRQICRCCASLGRECTRQRTTE